MIYITNIKFPTPKAHGIQTANMCAAFARAGEPVTLVVPRRRNRHKANPFGYYNIEQNFSVKYLPTIDLITTGLPFAFAVQTLTFAISSFVFLLFQKGEPVIYTRGEVSLIWASFLSKRFTLFWETHIPPAHMSWYERLLKRSSGVIVVTESYKNELVERGLALPEKILFAPDGVDPGFFSCSELREKDKRDLGLPEGKKLVLYAGSDVTWKGLSVLRRAAKLLPEPYRVVFVGNVEKHKDDAPQSLFVGRRPYMEIPRFIHSADVAVLTADPKSEVAQKFTSPLKLFEYMAMGSVIVAPDTLAIRDVVSEREVFFYEAGSEKSLAQAIREAAENKSESEKRAQAALQRAPEYTWDARAKNILQFIQKPINVEE